MGINLKPRFGPEQAELESGWQRLLAVIKQLHSVAVAFSGGVDSALLLAACVAALGPQKVRAVHCAGAFTPPWERERAQSLAAELGVELIEVDAQELSHRRLAANDAKRCYWCKHLRMGRINELAAQLGMLHTAEGSQLDDAKEDRPGERAVREHGVKSPLAMAGLDKVQVRALSRALGLPTAQTPASACLASRIPRGRAIEQAALDRIAAVESRLRRHLSGRLRVRDHFPIARIEVEPDQMAKAAADPLASLISRTCKKAGYEYACLDLGGYRTGGGDGPA